MNLTKLINQYNQIELFKKKTFIVSNLISAEVLLTADWFETFSKLSQKSVWNMLIRERI